MNCIMGLDIKELYNKYETIIKYSTFAFAGWFLSWVLFFIMLPGMIDYFGKAKGTLFNYVFSWISLFITFKLLTILLDCQKRKKLSFSNHICFLEIFHIFYLILDVNFHVDFHLYILQNGFRKISLLLYLSNYSLFKL